MRDDLNGPSRRLAAREGGKRRRYVAKDFGGAIRQGGGKLPQRAQFRIRHERLFNTKRRLNVIDSQGKRTIASEINDEADTVDLGRWLSARTGFPLTVPRQLQ